MISGTLLFLFQMLWSHERTRRWELFGASKFVKAVSNKKLNGPTKMVWFIETFILVFTAYGLAYVVPQVSLITLSMFYGEFLSLLIRFRSKGWGVWELLCDLMM